MSHAYSVRLPRRPHRVLDEGPGGAWRNALHAYLGGTLRGLGTFVYTVGGTSDHVHVAAGLKPAQAVADVVRELKKATSKWAADHCEGFAWQTGYGAFSFSFRERQTIVSYVNGQEQHHLRVTSADELRALLAEHDIAYDERYFV